MNEINVNALGGWREERGWMEGGARVGGCRVGCNCLPDDC